MEVKHNEATKNRPAGSRDLDAPFIVVDIPGLIRQLKSEKAWLTSDRNGITAYKSGEHTIVLSGLHQGAKTGANSVKGFLTIQLMEGSIRADIGGQQISLDGSGIICIHPEVTYNIEAASDAMLLLHDHS